MYAWLNIYVYIYKYVYIHTCVYVYMYIYIYICRHINVLYIYMYICIYWCGMHTFSLQAWLLMYVIGIMWGVVCVLCCVCVVSISIRCMCLCMCMHVWFFREYIPHVSIYANLHIYVWWYIWLYICCRVWHLGGVGKLWLQGQCCVSVQVCLMYSNIQLVCVGIYARLHTHTHAHTHTHTHQERVTEREWERERHTHTHTPPHTHVLIYLMHMFVCCTYMCLYIYIQIYKFQNNTNRSTHVAACLFHMLMSCFACSCPGWPSPVVFCRTKPSWAGGGGSTAARIPWRCKQGWFGTMLGHCRALRVYCEHVCWTDACVCWFRAWINTAWTYTHIHWHTRKYVCTYKYI